MNMAKKSKGGQFKSQLIREFKEANQAAAPKEVTEACPRLAYRFQFSSGVGCSRLPKEMR